jgi:hypothetical protein
MYTLTVVNFIRIWYDLSEKNPVRGFGICTPRLQFSRKIGEDQRGQRWFSSFWGLFRPGSVEATLFGAVLYASPLSVFVYHHSRTHGSENRAYRPFA